MNKFEFQLEKTPNTANAIISALLEILLTLIVWVGGMYFIVKTFGVYIPNPNSPNVSEETRFAFYLLFLSFGLPLISLFLMRKIMSGKGIVSLFNANRKFKASNFLAGFAISALILISTILAAEPKALNLAIIRFKSFGLSEYSMIVSVYFLGFFVQTMFEEVFFRAAIVQHLTRTGLPLVFALLTSAIIFAIFHIGQNIRFEVIIGVFIMGVSYNYATFRTQGIELSMGAHFANNLMVGAIIGSFDNAKNFDNALISGVIYAVIFVALLETFIKFAQRPNAENSIIS